MFWNAFSYKYKGPYHFNKLETIKEEKIMENIIKKLNKKLDLAFKKNES